jgi:metallo-beta-lactamase family protein
MVEGNPTVKIHGEEVPVAAKIESISGFSGHADYDEIMAWLMGFNRPPEKTFLVHGEPEASEVLAEKIRLQFGWDVVVPEFGDSFELDL